MTADVVLASNFLDTSSSEVLTALGVALALIVLMVVVLYVVIRFAVKHGERDARR